MNRLLMDRTKMLRDHINEVMFLEASDRNNPETFYRLSKVSSCNELIHALFNQKTITDKDILTCIDNINNILDDICYIIYPHIDNSYIYKEFILLQNIILFNYDTMIKYSYMSDDFYKADHLKKVKKLYKNHFPSIFDEEYIRFK